MILPAPATQCIGPAARYKLIVTAATEPEDLYAADASGNESGRFEFERTVSRLNEMQSAEYMSLGHGED